MLPAPRVSGTLRSAPLYWCAYGPASAPRVVVLHGGPGAHHDYLLPQMLRLAEHHEVIFYDQRGGGRSRSDDRGPITWRTHVEDLDCLVGELGVAPLDLVGYSWGGLLAALYAIEAAAGRTGHLPSRMVLIDPAAMSRRYRDAFETEFARRGADDAVVRLREELARSGLRETDPDAYRKRAFELSVAGYFADPRSAKDLTPFRVMGRAQQSVWESLDDYDLLAPGGLDSVSVPSLVLHGRQDPIPLASSEACAARLRAQLVVIEECGHVPYVERADALFPPIEAFLGTA